MRERIAQLRRRLDEVDAHARACTGGARASVPYADGRAGRLHQRRQVDADERAHRAPACWSRTSCSRRSTRPCAACACPSGGAALLVDTVGFIHKLPHQLVDAFKSTLEEVRTADLLLHVVDASHPTLARARAGHRGGAGGDRRRRAAGGHASSTRPTAWPRHGAPPGRAARRRSGSRPRDGDGLQALPGTHRAPARRRARARQLRAAVRPRRRAWRGCDAAGACCEEYYRDGLVTVTALVPPSSPDSCASSFPAPRERLGVDACSTS